LFIAFNYDSILFDIINKKRGKEVEEREGREGVDMSNK